MTVDMDKLGLALRARTEKAERAMKRQSKEAADRNFGKAVALTWVSYVADSEASAVRRLWRDEEDDPFGVFIDMYAPDLEPVWLYRPATDLHRLLDKETLMKTRVWQRFTKLAFRRGSTDTEQATVVFKVKRFGVWCVTTASNVRTLQGAPRICVPVRPDLDPVTLFPFTVFLQERYGCTPVT